MLPVEGKSREILVSGYVTPPEEARASSKSFYFFLNQRPINSRLLWKALNQAFRGFMMKNSYPMGALFLEVQPDQVDVNVHPAKQEVRFHDSDAIYRIVYHSVQRALEGIKVVAAPFGKTRARLEEAGLAIDQQELDIPPDAFQVSEEFPAYGGFPSSGQNQKTALNPIRTTMSTSLIEHIYGRTFVFSDSWPGVISWQRDRMALCLWTSMQLTRPLSLRG
jgi:hypothetical protein